MITDATKLSNQKGSTLIVVMIVLLMLTIVGVFAIRTAMTTLNIATNAQTNQLLSQSADAPINGLQNQNVGTIRNLGSVIGFAIEDSKVEQGKEYIFCYRPTSPLRLANTISMAVARVGAGGAITAEGPAAAFCDLSADFGSSREAVVTQVSVKIPVDPPANSLPGDFLTQGNNESEGQITQTGTVKQRIRITTTAIFPVYAANQADAQACVRTRLNDNTDSATAGFVTVAQCLANLGVPVNSQMQEFYLQDWIEQLSEI